MRAFVIWIGCCGRRVVRWPWQASSAVLAIEGQGLPPVPRPRPLPRPGPGPGQPQHHRHRGHPAAAQPAAAPALRAAPRGRCRGNGPVCVTEPGPEGGERLVWAPRVGGPRRRGSRQARRPAAEPAACRGRPDLLLPGQARGHRHHAGRARPAAPGRPAAMRSPLPGQPSRPDSRRRRGLRRHGDADSRRRRRLRRRYGLRLWFRFRRGQRPSPPGSPAALVVVWAAAMAAEPGAAAAVAAEVADGAPAAAPLVRAARFSCCPATGPPWSEAGAAHGHGGQDLGLGGAGLRRGTERVKGMAMPSGASLLSVRDARKGLRALARWPACCRL